VTRAREAEYYPDFTNPGHGTDVEGRMERAGRGEGVYNVVVIGGGTAGLVTAAGTAALGGRVALVERHLMGGDCLNYGCVPSKALIASARVATRMRHAGLQALDPVDVAVDYGRVVRRLKALRARIEPHDSAARYEGLGVDVFLGQAALESPRAVAVGGTALRTRHIVLATGGRAAIPDVPGLQEAGFLTNETVFEREQPPGRLLVLGGGPIGCELAQAMARLGARVTLIDRGRQLLHREDPDVAALVQARLEADGVGVLLRARVESIAPGRDGAHRARVRQDSDDPGTAASRDVETDTILVATGRRPNTEGLGLEKAGVASTPKGVTVNRFLMTSRSNIYAAGDLCGPYQFTHFAEYQARLIVRNILLSPLGGLGRVKADYRVVPWTTFTEPEVARVGLNETDATRAGILVDVHRFPYAQLDRAILESDETGFVKVVAARGKDTLLGATVVGAGAGEVIHELALAMRERIGLSRLSSMIHVYPTFSQAVQRSADAFMRTRLTPRARALFSRLYAWQRRSS
jgi:pyruvate/2-oxoglutarate dehydrogenase complex dihydrolipoamide dehydrogenase (E3) component